MPRKKTFKYYTIILKEQRKANSRKDYFLMEVKFSFQTKVTTHTIKKIKLSNAFWVFLHFIFNCHVMKSKNKTITNHTFVLLLSLLWSFIILLYSKKIKFIKLFMEKPKTKSHTKYNACVQIITFFPNVKATIAEFSIHLKLKSTGKKKRTFKQVIALALTWTSFPKPW